MKDSVYLVMSKHGVVAHRKTRPKLKSGYIAIKVNVEVDDAYFDRFIPKASLIVPETAVLRPEIEVELENFFEEEE